MAGQQRIPRKRSALADAEVRPRRSAPPPPRRRVSDQLALAIVLLIVGALGGAVLFGLASAPPSSAGATASPVPTDDSAAIPTDDGSGAGPSDAPVSPILEALVPTSVDDTALTVQSAVDATSLSSGADGRALNAAVTKLGKTPTDLQIVYAYDESGSTDLVILGFRVDGIGVADLRSAILGAWLAANTPGVVSTTVNWSGTPVTKVSYGDELADEYVFTVNDNVFVVETVDSSMAAGAGTAIVAQAAKASPGPAASAAPSPAATPAATP